MNNHQGGDRAPHPTVHGPVGAGHRPCPGHSPRPVMNIFFNTIKNPPESPGDYFIPIYLLLFVGVGFVGFRLLG